MTERPILFSAPMVRAILDNRKTQTRRVVKTPLLGPRIGNKRRFYFLDRDDDRTESVGLCPYGKAGDRLWVRESILWRPEHDNFYFAADDRGCGTEVYKRLQKRSCPSIHMPRWASRLTLEVTDVRIERLQEITEEDAEAEGAFALGDAACSHREWFRGLWDNINGKRAPWASNPLVWVVSFRRPQS